MTIEDERREQVLGTVRRSLGNMKSDKARRAIVRGRLENHPKGEIPARAQVNHFKQVDLFVEMAGAVDASVDRVKTKADILDAVTEFLRSRNLPQSLIHGDDAYFADLPWGKHKTLEHRRGPAAAKDLVSLAKAHSGVAETGTLMMASGADNPVTLNFLPDVSIVVLETKDITGDYETAWDRLREKFGEREMPRTLNMVTGPSRTADIEQTLLLGAHGPRSVHIIIVGR